jgi:hypothetical protein
VQNTIGKKDFSHRPEKVISIGFADAIGFLHHSANAAGTVLYSH